MLFGVVFAVFLLSAVSIWASTELDGGRLPALLEPYAGHSVVFSAHGDRVLGPAAAVGVQAMLESALPALPRGCTPTDIQISAHVVRHTLDCDGRTFSLNLTLTQRAKGEGAAVSSRFSISAPALSPGVCEGACLALRDRLLAAVLARVRAGEQGIVLQRVRRRRGAGPDRWSDDLEKARIALATGSTALARSALAEALRRRSLGSLDAEDAFDLILLAHASADEALKARALSRLRAALQALGSRATAAQAGLKVALSLLTSPHGGALQDAMACVKARDRCDFLPVVRALAASDRFAEAAAAMDAGPLAEGAPAAGLELLKLRFGLASALGDAETELRIARLVMRRWPASPVGPDLLSAGLLRAGRYREAIEQLYEISLAHPDRDIVLGRIAGMVAFLRDAAGRDPKFRDDLRAIQERMKLASAHPKDIVARFLNATRKYYSGDLRGALPELEALRSTDNRDPRIPLYLAMAHFWLGHQAQARALIEQAVLVGPSDPDVFYCRSQIARHRDLPLAISDLERYLKMTNRPWALNPEKKDARVKAELDFMRRGLLPPNWDRPGPQRVPFDPEHQTGTPLSEAVRQGTLPAEVSVSAAGLSTHATSSEGGPEGDSRSDHGDRGGDRAPWPLMILLALIAASIWRLWRWRRG